MSFIPEDLELPGEAGGYMKLEKGKNKFRALSNTLRGYEWWTEDEEGNRSPERVENEKEIPKEYLDEARYFWAFAVWNYDAEEIQILEITQKTIMRPLLELIRNDKWGDPKDYDLTINREGDGFETKYTITPDPKAKLPKEIADEYKKMNIDLTALLEGGNPFAG
jgi:hypothetical protein